MCLNISGATTCVLCKFNLVWKKLRATTNSRLSSSGEWLDLLAVLLERLIRFGGQPWVSPALQLPSCSGQTNTEFECSTRCKALFLQTSPSSRWGNGILSGQLQTCRKPGGQPGQSAPPYKKQQTTAYWENVLPAQQGNTLTENCGFCTTQSCLASFCLMYTSLTFSLCMDTRSVLHLCEEKKKIAWYFRVATW